MKKYLSKQEKDFIRKSAHMSSDSQIANELTRIRYELGIDDTVSTKRVRVARSKMGLKKHNGTGFLKRDKDE